MSQRVAEIQPPEAWPRPPAKPSLAAQLSEFESHARKGGGVDTDTALFLIKELRLHMMQLAGLTASIREITKRIDRILEKYGRPVA